MERWRPSRTVTKQEQFILKRLEKKRKLFGFLRLHRHENFNAEFQAELESMYRGTGARQGGRYASPIWQLWRSA